jgi:hypothetical protein
MVSVSEPLSRFGFGGPATEPNQMEINFTITLETILSGKLHNWRRRSTIGYAAASALIGISAWLFEWTESPVSIAAICLLSFGALAVLSIATIIISSILQIRRIRTEARDQLTIKFTNEGLTIENTNGLQFKPWSWIKEFQLKKDLIILRAAGGFFSEPLDRIMPFRQLYMFIRRSGLAPGTFEFLSEMLIERVK